MNILINATNLHFGGGVQVASSFISELTEIIENKAEKYQISVLCSTSVKSNLSANCDLSQFVFFKEINVYGFNKLSKEKKYLFDGYDVCFTIFGPFYYKPKVSRHICGFAQPWIAYPDNDVYPKLTIVNLIKTKLKFSIQSYFFKQYDKLIVEQQHVKSALIKIGYEKDNIHVVSNCVSTVYDNPQSWKELSFDDLNLKHDLTLGFIGRSYPHKNVAILKKVNQILINKYKLNCNFVFTFTDEEMQDCGFFNLDNFITVGSITVEQCPTFYKLLDALIFPSLLECFSASPIEAMKMKTTVIASNYPFITEVCKDAGFYFDPLNEYSIAESIASVFTNTTLIESKKILGSSLIKKLPTAKQRAVSYLDIILN